MSRSSSGSRYSVVGIFFWSATAFREAMIVRRSVFWSVSCCCNNAPSRARGSLEAVLGSVSEAPIREAPWTADVCILCIPPGSRPVRLFGGRRGSRHLPSLTEFQAGVLVTPRRIHAKTMILSKSPRLFMERRGLLPTWRTPAPQFRSDNPVHPFPVTFPLPAAALQLGQAGNPPPDRIVTKTWPNGGESV